jgi:hypothetical protein
MRSSVSVLLAASSLVIGGCSSPPVGSVDAASTTDAGPSLDGGALDSAVDDAGGAPLVRNEDFAEAAGEVRNPDRGFYFWDDHEEAALVLVKVLLDAQCDTAMLPSSVLDALRTRLDGHRAAGRRVILRFDYADDGVLNGCGLADAESLDLVLGHVSQLAPIFSDYEDVIAYVEAGFFGMWGEWNQEYAPAGTSLSEDEANRDALLTALLDAVPATRSIEVRRPRFRDELGATDVQRARIGFHNDCFLSSADDSGTYDGGHDIGFWKAYIHNNALTVPMGGETCHDDPTYTACDHALEELELLRFSYLHEGYSPEVIARWDTEGCLDEIRRRLGYRLVITAIEAPASLAPGDRLRVRVELDNVGFAPPYDARRVRILLRSSTGTEVDLGTPATIDTTGWDPEAPPFGFIASGNIPADLAAGTYEVRLAMLEDASDLPAYALMFANDERVRDDVRRENIVATLTITE